jgi:peptidoglycan/LPS O-acetylase OafA/YrhL
MRAVAVILVVLFHAGLAALAGGYIGVDVFFVLSGFLITGLLLDELRRTGTVSLTGFYARRARRLLPMSALVLVSTVALAHSYLAPIDFGSLLGDVRAATLYFSNWHFAAQSTNYMSDANKSPVLHYWSLSVEEQFYLVWPLLLLAVTAGRRRRWGTTVRRVSVGLAVLGIGSLALSIFTTASDGPWAYFGLHTRAWELSAGGALAVARPALARLRASAAGVVGWAGLGMVIASALLYGADTPFPGWAALLPVGGAVLLIGAGAAPHLRWSASSLLSVRPITYVGRISYSWYLWHWPLLVFAAHRFGSTPEVEGGDSGQAASLPVLPTVATVLLSLVLAVACHHLLESPVRRARWLITSQGRSLVMGAAATLVVVLAAAIGLAPNTLLPHTFASRAFATAQGGQQSVTATRSTPVILAESPITARNDKPRGTEACFVEVFTISKAGGPCIFGDRSATRTMVLLGDSQAEQWIPAMNAYGRSHHWKVYLWAKISCPFNDVPIWLTAYKGDYTACQRWRENVYAAISHLDRVDVAVLSRGRSYVAMVIKRDGRKSSVRTVEPYWRDGTRRTLDRLAGVTNHVVLLHSTPGASSDVPACLSQHTDNPSACDFPAVAGTGDVLFAAERKAALPTGAQVVDLTAEICPSDPCPVVAPSGVIIYRDEHHLTATFARSLAEQFGQMIVQAVRRHGPSQ